MRVKASPAITLLPRLLPRVAEPTKIPSKYLFIALVLLQMLSKWALKTKIMTLPCLQITKTEETNDLKNAVTLEWKHCFKMLPNSVISKAHTIEFTLSAHRWEIVPSKRRGCARGEPRPTTQSCSCLWLSYQLLPSQWVKTQWEELENKTQDRGHILRSPLEGYPWKITTL